MKKIHLSTNGRSCNSPGTAHEAFSTYVFLPLCLLCSPSSAERKGSSMTSLWRCGQGSGVMWMYSKPHLVDPSKKGTYYWRVGRGRSPAPLGEARADGGLGFRTAVQAAGNTCLSSGFWDGSASAVSPVHTSTLHSQLSEASPRRQPLPNGRLEVDRWTRNMRGERLPG